MPSKQRTVFHDVARYLALFLLGLLFLFCMMGAFAWLHGRHASTVDAEEIRKIHDRINELEKAIEKLQKDHPTPKGTAYIVKPMT